MFDPKNHKYELQHLKSVFDELHTKQPQAAIARISTLLNSCIPLRKCGKIAKSPIEDCVYGRTQLQKGNSNEEEKW